ncbi:hypothetical protein DCAR_0415516 [Daucus carota subsp. sativus]|uniref:Uncharacterized protein n=1 Tax=Daucus carota subsp. sativus TaxID=79200 RepID=A0AAF0WUA3_DAUCS|nr:hypothetical protein DCAR_0415516 [Daucus carota subsp. sativus]
MERNSEGEKENHNEVEKIQLIDFSSEDDILVDYPFRDSLEDLRLSESLKMANQREVENAGNSLHQREEMLSTPEFLEPRRPSYLRKSIAWDNAFFSSDGVLDPEELSAMNNGFKGLETSFFPGIPEDLKMRRSVDSDLTFESLESDAFSLESDAFSLESFDGNLFEDVRASIHRSCGPLKLTSASCDSIIGKAASSDVPDSKKFHVSTQNKHKGEYNLTPKISGAQTTITRQPKRVSLGYGCTGNKRTGNGQGLMVHKKSGSLDSPNSINFSTPLTKSSSTVSLSTTKSSSVAGSSCNELSSATSSKSILSSGTRNIGSSSSKIGSSGSISKPPLRYSGRSRSRLSKETSSIHLLSVSHNSNKSPASSIDGWSSESSSSTCSGTAKRRSSMLEDKLRRDTDQASALNQLTRRRMSADQHMKGALKETASVPIEPPNSLKSSGLRMPSPRIGFFDVDKSGTIETMHFRFRSENTSSDLNVDAVKKRPSKFQPVRCVPGRENNISTLAPGRTMHSKHPDNALSKSTIMKNSLGLALKLRAVTTFEVGNAYCSKTRKVGKGEDERQKIMLTSSLKTEEKRNKGILKNKMGKERKDQKARNSILPEPREPVKKDHDAAPARKLDSPCESKENFEEQVNGLSRCLEAIDLGGNAVKLERIESADGQRFPGGQQQESPGVARIPLADKIIASHRPSPLQISEESN